MESKLQVPSLEGRDEININRNRILRWVLIITGTISVALGILGIFLPLLPTTVFFLLAAWCYSRSSERFYNWLHHNRFFGKYLTNYRIGGGMTLLSKIFSMTLLWGAILYSVIFVTANIYIRIILIVIAVSVSWHLIAIKTSRRLN